MAINKVTLDGNDLIDLTQDTVTPESVASGVTFHDAAGNSQTGTYTSPSGIVDVGTLVMGNNTITSELAQSLESETCTAAKVTSSGTTMIMYKMMYGEPGGESYTFTTFGYTITDEDGGNVGGTYLQITGTSAYLFEGIANIPKLPSIKPSQDEQKVMTATLQGDTDGYELKDISYFSTNATVPDDLIRGGFNFTDSDNYMTVKKTASTLEPIKVDRANKDGNGNNIVDTYAPKQTTSGGFVAGENATAPASEAIAIGNEAAGNGVRSVAIGSDTKAQTTSIAIGSAASGTGNGSVALGVAATTSAQYSVGVGYHATANNEGAVQIGDGTNSTANTLQFRSYQLLDANGNIPSQRLLSLYPIGSYYITESEITPASLLGGSWVRVENLFLRGAPQSYAGNQGGEDAHTLTVTEMPSHSHKLHNWALIVSEGANSGSFNMPSVSGKNGMVNVFNEDGDQNRYSENTGGGQPFNNIPGYRYVYIWRRTA